MLLAEFSSLQFTEIDQPIRLGKKGVKSDESSGGRERLWTWGVLSIAA
jgi:hypothetical protein